MSYQDNPFLPQMLSPAAHEIGRYITELRKSWCEGDSIFVPYDIKEEPVILSYWIE